MNPSLCLRALFTALIFVEVNVASGCRLKSAAAFLTSIGTLVSVVDFLLSFLQASFVSQMQTRKARSTQFAHRKVCDVWEKSKVRNRSIPKKTCYELFPSDELVSLKSEKRKIECDCMPNCDNTNFFIQSIVSVS